MKIKEGKSALEQNLYRSFLLLSATLVLISLGFTPVSYTHLKVEREKGIRTNFGKETS